MNYSEFYSLLINEVQTYFGSHIYKFQLTAFPAIQIRNSWLYLTVYEYENSFGVSTFNSQLCEYYLHRDFNKFETLNNLKEKIVQYFQLVEENFKYDEKHSNEFSKTHNCFTSIQIKENFETLKQIFNHQYYDEYLDDYIQLSENNEHSRVYLNQTDLIFYFGYIRNLNLYRFSITQYNKDKELGDQILVQMNFPLYIDEKIFINQIDFQSNLILCHYNQSKEYIYYDKIKQDILNKYKK